MLRAAGLDPSKDCWITNLICCKPPENRTPNNVEINLCSRILRGEIELIKPDLIFAVGATAANELTGRRVAITREQGKIVDTKYGKVCMIVHPAYILRIDGTDKGTDAKIAQLNAVKGALETIK